MNRPHGNRAHIINPLDNVYTLNSNTVGRLMLELPVVRRVCNLGRLRTRKE
jgi:hypothetical protein